MTLNLAVGQNTNVVQLPQNLIAWHSRDSGGGIASITTTETGFIRIDGITIRNGYHYYFLAPQVNATTSNKTDTVANVKLRYNLAGNATTTSSVLPYGGFFRKAQAIDISNTDVESLHGAYHASADGTLSVIMTLVRAAGTGSVGLFASAANPCPLFVYEMGLYPAVSGVDI